MVPIRNIRTTSCPVCGCTTVVIESVETELDRPVIRHHCNGGQWENRKFACGYEVRYVPNFLKEERVAMCKKDPELIGLKQKTDSLKQTLFELIGESDLPDHMKKRFSDNIKYVGGA